MIIVQDIHKSYNNVEVLRGITLSVRRGKVTTIVGPSGAGKTTLLQIVGSLEPVDRGTVMYGDTDITTLKDKELSRFRNKNIGLVFQAHRLLPEFTIMENAMMPALIARTPVRQAEQEARKLLERLGLGHRLNHRPSQLSGGENQRASVARALINHPSIVLADEPTGSLDTENRRQLHRIFFDLRDELGTTFAIVTHDENLAADSDTVIHLRDGLIESIYDARP